MNSCNPVFIDVGQRLGVEQYYHYFIQFGLKGKTGVDLPGEASTIMHKKENMGPVELATGVLWPVVSDHPIAADHYGGIHRERRNSGDPSFRHPGGQSERRTGTYIYLSAKGRDRFQGDQ